MEENMMNNEEVIETTAGEIVKTTSHGGFKTVTTIGLAMIVGGLAYKFVVEPAAVKIKIWRENRKAEKQHVVINSFADGNVEVEEEI